MAHVKDWRSLSTPNEEWEAAMSKLPARPSLGAFGQDIPGLRKYMMEARRKMNAAAPETPGISIADHNVSMRDGTQIICRVYIPDGKTGSPLAVVYHGGGWNVGGLDNEDMLCRALAGKLGVVAVNVDYRLAPEHKYPVALHDCYDATKWALAQSSTLGTDPSKGFLISGTSAGGNMAAVVTLLLRDEKISTPVTGTHLQVPALCVDEVVPAKYRADYHSWEQNKDADILDRHAAELLIGNYIPDAADRNSTMFNPLIWPTGLKGTPATFLQVCGHDPLRDEALIYERILREEEGVKTRLEVYPGVPHAFWSTAPTLKISQQYRLDAVAGLQWLLAQSS